jgi:hypothetical protein
MCDFVLKFGAKAGSAAVKPPNLDPKIKGLIPATVMSHSG